MFPNPEIAAWTVIARAKCRARRSDRDCIIVYDERWRPVSVNSAALDALAVSRAQLMGRAGHDPAWRIVGPDGEPIDPKQAPSAIAMRTGVETTGIVGATRGDGETTWLAVRAYCVDDYRKRLTIATFDVL